MNQILVVSVSFFVPRVEQTRIQNTQHDDIIKQSGPCDLTWTERFTHFVCIPAALRSTLTSTLVFDFLFCLFVYLFSLLKVGVNRKRTKNKRRPQVVPLGGLLRPLGEANYWNKWWPTESQVIVLKLTRAETRHREDELKEGSGNKPVISK